MDRMNMRAMPRKGLDIVVFNNEDYLIFRKNGATVGVAMMPADMMFIGLAAFNPTMNVFKYFEDWQDFLDGMEKAIADKCHELREIKREGQENRPKNVHMHEKTAVPDGAGRPGDGGVSK